MRTLLALFVLVSLPAHGAPPALQSITRIVPIDYADCDNIFETHSIRGFDPALGTLQSVTIDWDIDTEQVIGLENISENNALTLQVGLCTNPPFTSPGIECKAGIVLQTGEITATFLDRFYGSIFPLVSGTFTKYDGDLDFAGSSGLTNGPVFSSGAATNRATLTSPSILGYFTTAGFVDVEIARTSVTGGCGTGAFSEQYKAGGGLGITFNY